ncbi:hypothetical protein JKP88DRAFT_279152 [Tribonema minus]|uniref:Telomere resolvase ResT/TelK catalytic domain-containing protein n=1 Tax=Tribonema minus TaxID=303371 RepID=A0A835YT88_9STRA|nr:hypothetical protein JKP88DRAFT_279152 [Tribonema minus]
MASGSGGTTPAVLAAYLADTGDTEGVVAYIRQRWPKSLATYTSAVKRIWLSLERRHPEFEAAYAKALAAVEAERESGDPALELFRRFGAMTLAEQNAERRAMRTRAYTGDAGLDGTLASLPLLPEFIDGLRLPSKDRDDARLRASRALADKSAKSWVIRAGDLIERARGALADPSAGPFDLACAIALCSGRRMVEVFRTGDFAPAPRSLGPHACSFGGQVKRRGTGGEPGTAATAPGGERYDIPLLCPLKDLRAGVARLRASKPAADLTNAEVNLKWSGSCNAAARRWLGDGRKFHDLREAYAVCGYHLALPHCWFLNLWVSKVLGHAALANSLHYTCIHAEDLREEHRRPWRPSTPAAGAGGPGGPHGRAPPVGRGEATKGGRDGDAGAGAAIERRGSRTRGV